MADVCSLSQFCPLEDPGPGAVLLQIGDVRPVQEFAALQRKRERALQSREFSNHFSAEAGENRETAFLKYQCAAAGRTAVASAAVAAASYRGAAGAPWFGVRTIA